MTTNIPLCLAVSPLHLVNRVVLAIASALPSAASVRFGSHSFVVWLSVRRLLNHSLQNLGEEREDDVCEEECTAEKNEPKHLLWPVALSMKTLALTTLP